MWMEVLREFVCCDALENAYSGQSWHRSAQNSTRVDTTKGDSELWTSSVYKD